MSQYVYVDTNILVQQGRDLESADISLLKDLADAGDIRLLSTDLSIDELVKKFVANGMKELGDLGRPLTRKLAKSALHLDLPEIDGEAIRRSLDDFFRDRVRRKFISLGVRIHSIDGVKPSGVFSDYHRQVGMFSASAKKSQFPDAFILAALLPKVPDKQSLIVWTNDGDYLAYARAEPRVTCVQTTEELLEVIGYQQSDREVEDFLQADNEKLQELALSEIQDWGLIASDVEGAEIYDFVVDDIHIDVYRVFDPVREGDEITVYGSATIDLSVSFTHPDWSSAIRDSDTKEFLTFRDVSGETTTELKVGVTIRVLPGPNGDPEEITQLALVSKYGLQVNIDQWV